MKVVFVCLLSAMLELWLFNTRSLREVASFSFIICFSERPSSPRDEEAQVAHTHTHTPSCPLSRRFITDVCPLLPSSRRHLLLRAAGGGVKGWSFYNAMRQQMGLSIMRCVCVCDFAACWEKTQMFSGFVVGVKAGTYPGRRSGRSSERLPVHHRADLFN